uniref:Uncharacterized protein n=1 Tax=Arundo donax TaxID=35708 RepID=A0A0A9DQ46_ARUDO
MYKPISGREGTGNTAACMAYSCCFVPCREVDRNVQLFRKKKVSPSCVAPAAVMLLLYGRTLETDMSSPLLRKTQGRHLFVVYIISLSISHRNQTKRTANHHLFGSASIKELKNQAKKENYNR